MGVELTVSLRAVSRARPCIADQVLWQCGCRESEAGRLAPPLAPRRRRRTRSDCVAAATCVQSTAVCSDGRSALQRNRLTRARRLGPAAVHERPGPSETVQTARQADEVRRETVALPGALGAVRRAARL